MKNTLLVLLLLALAGCEFDVAAEETVDATQQSMLATMNSQTTCINQCYRALNESMSTWWPQASNPAYCVWYLGSWLCGGSVAERDAEVARCIELCKKQYP